MNPRLAHLLTRLYPRAWQERYAAEFEALLLTGPGGLRTAANIILSALTEHIAPTQAHTMVPYPRLSTAIVRRPSAFLPIAMSFTALTMVLIYLAIDLVHNGHIVLDPDEGAVAHLWQLLMAGQLPIVAFFAIRWLPRIARQSLQVLAIQATGVLANLALIFFLGLG